MTIALIGNQNSGKTTLFNQLTGSNRRTGNFPGVTVEKKSGDVIGHKDFTVVDLPGIYSLSPYSKEEIVTRDFLLKEKPDAIINIVDATNIERNLYLTLQLIELQIPMIIALNMMDEIRANNGSVDIKGLKKEFGVDVIPISAVKNQGITELIGQTVHITKHRTKPERLDFCTGAAHRTIHAIAHLIEDHAQYAGIPGRFASVKLAEGDEIIRESLNLDQNEKETIEHAVRAMETELDMDREAALVDMRYRFIEKVCVKSVIKATESKEYKRSAGIDSVLTNKHLAFPAFLSIMFLIFWLTFGVIGNRLSDLLGIMFEALSNGAYSALTAFGLNAVVKSLIIDGIIAGVGAVLSFAPVIVTLFFFLSILEDSGYMARVAYVMDKPLRKIGLSGRSFVPMLMGFGCSVPAIMATRTLAGDRDRKMTILLIPFMSCGAKIPVYTLFTAAFFKKHQALIMMGLYITGIIFGLLTSIILRKIFFKGEPVPFVMELPNYRLPSAKTVVLLMWDKTKDFIQKALTVILLAAVVIWFLQMFDIRMNIVANTSDSILASIGRLFSVFFAPLGFPDWRASTALITGFIAKEAVISTFAVLETSPEALFTSASALAFLVFTLLYVPCVAAVAAAKREYGNLKGAAFILLYQTGIAWLAGFITYQVFRCILV